MVSQLYHSQAYIPELDLVAEKNGEIVGHLLMTQGHVGRNTNVLGLAPLSVLPKFHKMGIGTALMYKGHEVAKKLGFDAIFVLGRREKSTAGPLRQQSSDGVFC